MSNVTIESFNATLNALLDANPHAKSKGDDFKNWCLDNFNVGARISHIREQRQTTNRVSEQFRYFDPVVVFVCDDVVKRDVLIQYVTERLYKQLECIAIIGVTQSLDDQNQPVNTYTFEHLRIYKYSLFGEWAANYFNEVERITENVSYLTATPINPSSTAPELVSQDYQYMAAAKTKPFLILGGFSGTGKSIAVKSLAFATCPCDGILNTSETTPGNYMLLSVKPNWHDATDITGFRSSVNRNYYVTDFMRFIIRAKLYEAQQVPFFLCLDEMNLAPVEEYFSDFLSVIESRKKRSDGKIVTDALIPASVFNSNEYADDFNIFLSLGIKPTEEVSDITEFNATIRENGDDAAYEDQWLVQELKQYGMTIPQNLIVIGTVNMDDTTNSFSRKVIDRAMTFETIVEKFSVEDYFGEGNLLMEYCEHPTKGELYISDEVRATELDEDYLSADEKKKIIEFINNINTDLAGTPFQISYRVLNETILLYRAKKEIDRILGGEYEEGVEFSLDLNQIFDDILMQKVLPRIEGDYEKCHKALAALITRANEENWKRSAVKLEFMERRFGSDKSGFTSFWN